MEEREQYGTPAADIGKLAAALVKAQGELTNPVKNKTVTVRTKEKGSYSYSYADLGSIVDHVRPSLAKHGLAIIQRIDTTPDAVTLITELIHESGQLVSSSQPLPKGCSAQEFGSYLTYARRYSVCALLGIAAEDDDDGTKGNMAKTGGSEESARDELMERVCNDSVSNIGLVRWCQAEGLVDEEAKIADDLPIEVIKTVLERWPDVVKAVRELAKKAPTRRSTMVPPADQGETEDEPKAEKPATKEAKPATKPATSAPTAAHGAAGAAAAQLELLPPKLRKLMIRDKISPAMLKAVYVAAGHLPNSVEPPDMPEDYVDQICEPDTWARLAAKAVALDLDK